MIPYILAGGVAAIFSGCGSSESDNETKSAKGSDSNSSPLKAKAGIGEFLERNHFFKPNSKKHWFSYSKDLGSQSDFGTKLGLLPEGYSTVDTSWFRIGTHQPFGQNEGVELSPSEMEIPSEECSWFSQISIGITLPLGLAVYCSRPEITPIY